MRPPVAFAVAFCHLVAEKMRQLMVGTVPECTEKKNCLSGDRTYNHFLLTNYQLVHIVVENACNPTEGENSIMSMAERLAQTEELRIV